MLSKSCQYAIRAVLYVGKNASEKNKVELKDIADGLNIPKPFLAKIMQQLVKRQLVNSVKGPHGGFYLSAKEKKKSLLDIVSAIDGLEYFNMCGLGIEECSPNKPCPVHNQVAKGREILLKSLKANTIEKVEKKLRNGEYVIVR